jgi:hypothetical protein
MGKTIYIAIEIIMFVIFLFELYFSLKIRKRKIYSPVLKVFYLYPIIGLVVGIVLFLSRMQVMPILPALFVNRISLIFHFSFLSSIFYYEIARASWFKFVFFISLLMLIILVFFEFGMPHNYSIAFANGVLFFFSIYYFYHLLGKEPILNVSKNPIFIIFCGVFLEGGLVVPYNSMTKFMFTLQIPNDTRYALGIFAALGYLIMNLFFLKVMIIISKYE